MYLRCVRCGRVCAPDPAAALCPHCPQDVDYPPVLEVVTPPPPHRALTTPGGTGIWRYADCLCLDPAFRVTLGEGGTPLLPSRRTGLRLGLQRLFFKNEMANPTGSFKDRLAAAVVSQALSAHARRLVLVSSGNMGAAVAAYAARAGLGCTVVVPPGTGEAKLAQTGLYGAQVVRVRGTGGDRLRLCLRACAELGWYNACSPLNPYGSEGARTTAYELWEQLGRRPPDRVIIPTGFGCNLVGHYQGFRDLFRVGLTDRLPCLVAVQPEGSPSLVRAFEKQREEAEPGPQDTVAGGISQRVTPNSRLALAALRASSGLAVAVSDEVILAAQRRLAAEEGLYAEPSAAAALAGLERLRAAGRVEPEETVVVLLTGSGLKDPATAAGLLPPFSPPIDADLAALRALGEQ